MDSLPEHRSQGPIRMPFRANDVYPQDLQGWRVLLRDMVEVAGPDDCWSWLGEIATSGYGRAMVAGRRLAAHRAAWVLANNRPLTDDLTIDHLCRNRSCVNPAHLEAVSVRVNSERAQKVPQPLRELLDQAVDAGRNHRGWILRRCPVCNVAYGARMLPSHIRDIHLRAA